MLRKWRIEQACLCLCLLPVVVGCGADSGDADLKSAAPERVVETAGAPRALAPSSQGVVWLERSGTELRIVAWEAGSRWTVLDDPSWGTLATPLVSGDQVYFTTTELSDSGDYVARLHRVPLAGGNPEVVYEALGTNPTIAQNSASVIWCSDDGIVALPKSGGPGTQLASLSSKSCRALAADDASVIFSSADELVSVPVAGGETKTLGGAVDEIALDADNVYFERDGVFSIPRGGGSPEALEPIGASIAVDSGFLYFEAPAPLDAYKQLASTINRVATDGGATRELVSGVVDSEHEMGGSLVYDPTPNGDYVYFSTLWGIYRIPR